MDFQPLRAALAQLFGSDVRLAGVLAGGEEALVLRAESARGALVIHLSPPWRTRAELEWVHALARHAQQHIPQVVAPIECMAASIFEVEGRLAALFPYVEGQILDRDDPEQRADAARMLAAIHRALSSWQAGARPASSLARPAPPADPLELADTALDRWWAQASAHGWVMSPIHGDYYRRNLLCRKRRIVGVIDWHDATIGPLALELAGATFELCRDDQHHLQLDRADAFVATYRAAGGCVPDDELALLPALVRVWVRNDARMALAGAPNLATNVYAARQARAFRELASCDWRVSYLPR
jgi:Ser/Thr protein kinase RdoA (MazF antagonist)